MSGVNVPLLRKAVEWAEAEYARADESEWNQSFWWSMPGSMWSEAKSQGKVEKIERPDSRGPEADFLFDPKHDWIDVSTVTVLKSDYITCQSTGCVAGYVASIHGDRAVRIGDNDVADDTKLVGDYVMDENNVVLGVKDRATELLGLEESQAARLFAPHNSIKDVRRIAEQIAGGAL